MYTFKITMSRLGCFFLVWVMSMTMLACESNRQSEFPAIVPHPDAQCVIYRGLDRSCPNRMHLGGELNCSSLECAAGRCGVNAGTFCAVDIGRAVDGTHCGDGKVCSQGSCIQLPADVKMPVEFGKQDGVMKCEKPHDYKPAFPLSLHRRLR